MPVPPKPALLVVEPYKGIRMVFPTFLELYLARAELILARDLNEAEALIARPENRDRVVGLITHGMRGEVKVAPQIVNVVDQTLGRLVPYVVLTGSITAFEDRDFPRPPLRIVEKGRGSIPDCLVPFKEHVQAAATA